MKYKVVPISVELSQITTRIRVKMIFGSFLQKSGSKATNALWVVASAVCSAANSSSLIVPDLSVSAASNISTVFLLFILSSFYPAIKISRIDA